MSYELTVAWTKLLSQMVLMDEIEPQTLRSEVAFPKTVRLDSPACWNRYAGTPVPCGTAQGQAKAQQTFNFRHMPQYVPVFSCRILLLIDKWRIALPVRLFLGILSTWQARFNIVFKRREMKNRISVSEVSEKLGYPSSETIEGLRLLKAFIKLTPSQRCEVIDMVEELATDPAPVPGGMNGRFSTR